MPTVSFHPDVKARLAEVQRVWRDNRALKRSSIGQYGHWISRFHRYCQEEALAPESQLTPKGVLAFSRWYAQVRGIDSDNARCNANSALRAWALGLQAAGYPIPPWDSTYPRTAVPSELLQAYAEHVRQYRGNPEGSIHKKVVHTSRFLDFLKARQRPLGQVQLVDIDDFLKQCSQAYARSTTADIASSLRSFLRFLRATGHIPTDLASSVLAPVVRRDERPPRALPWEDVRRILAVIDRHTTVGLRDYAMLLLMCTYGLGADEVIRLTLDDIDWQAATLRVTRPKTGVAFTLPLLAGVAHTLVQYLRRARPRHVPTRHVFLSMHVPHARLSCSGPVRQRIIEYARVAGVEAAFLGSHVMRFSHAARQMELGTAPKVLGDILGHRDPTSVSAYVRIATERLRDMALPVPR